MGFLESIGGFVILIVIVFLILMYMEYDDRKRRDNAELMKYVPKDKLSKKKDKGYDMYAKDTLKDKEVRAAAEKARQEDKDREIRRKKEENKQKTIKRVNSYEYENLVYEIYAPYCKYSSFYEKWYTDVQLHKDYIIKRILEIKSDKDSSVSLTDAKNLFNAMVEAEVLDCIYDNSATYCQMGIVLRIDWAVVSDEDMNIDKWIKKNGGDSQNNPFEKYVDVSALRPSKKSVNEKICIKDKQIEKTSDFEIGFIHFEVKHNYVKKLIIDSNEMRTVVFGDGTEIKFFTWEVDISNEEELEDSISDGSLYVKSQNGLLRIIQK